MNRRRLASAAILLIGLATALPASMQAAYAASQTVTTTADSGPGSLREAVAAAPSGGTVDFAPSVEGGTITLSSPISTGNPVTIDGGAAGVTITSTQGAGGVGTTQLFSVASDGNLTLAHLTLTGGYASASGGGAVGTGLSSSLTITDSTITGNHGKVNGGAILSHGSVTLTRVTLSGNVAETGHGGAIESLGSLTITQSTLSGNSSAKDGGAISVESSTTLTLQNSTVTGNTAGRNGGALYIGAATKLSFDTIAGNHAAVDGGGLWGSPTGISNTIISGNTIGAGSAAQNCSTPVTVSADNGNNLQFGDSTCGLALASDKTADPVLSGLVANPGFPATLDPGFGSAAINAGSCVDATSATTFTTDERGAARPAGPACDIGAVERQAPKLTGIAFTALEGTPFSGVVATMSDDPCVGACGYTVSIKWGAAGPTTSGTVDTSTTPRSIRGSHTYPSEGSASVTVSVTSTSGLAGSATSTATIAEVHPAGTVVSNLTAGTGGTFSGRVASFTDAGTEPITNFAASIAWGDGTTSAGVVSASSTPGVLNVSGTHTYTHNGNFTFTVSIWETDAAPSASIGTASGVLAVTTVPNPGSAAPYKPLPLLPIAAVLAGLCLLGLALPKRARLSR